MVNSFQIFDWNSNSKIKNIVPLVESKLKQLYLKAYEKPNPMTPVSVHGDSIAQFKVVEARNCVKRKYSPRRHPAKFQAQISTTEYVWVTLHENSKKRSSYGELLHMKTVFSKTCVNFGRCYGIQGWAEVVKKYFLFLKVVHLNFQKVSSP